MTKLKTFRVGVYESQSGFVLITAKNEKEAKKKAEKILVERGIEGFKNFNIQDRELNLI